MKNRRFALAMAFVLALALTGCSANRENNSAPVEPTDHVSGSDQDGQNSAGMGGNDAMQGGGAGGTNDRNNDGLPEGGDDDNVVDDIGDAAGDLARGAGDVVRDAGDAIGDAANNVGRAMR